MPRALPYIDAMMTLFRPLAPLFVLAALAAPLHAEQEAERGFNLMEEGAKLFLKGILQEVEPALRELEGLAEVLEPSFRSFAQEMGPALRDLMGRVKDWSVYEVPEILPNGDIIIRRKPDAPPLPEAPDEIEL